MAVKKTFREQLAAFIDKDIKMPFIEYGKSTEHEQRNMSNSILGIYDTNTRMHPAVSIVDTHNEFYILKATTLKPGRRRHLIEKGYLPSEDRECCCVIKSREIPENFRRNNNSTLLFYDHRLNITRKQFLHERCKYNLKEFHKIKGKLQSLRTKVIQRNDAS